MSDHLEIPPWVSRPLIPPGYISAAAAAVLMIAIDREQYPVAFDGPLELGMSFSRGYWQGEIAIICGSSLLDPPLLLSPPLSSVWKCLEAELPSDSRGEAFLCAEAALNDFRLALATEKIGSYVIRDADGIPTALPGTYWNTLGANSVLWDDRLVEFASGDKRLCGHAVIDLSDLQKYLTGREDKPWGFRVRDGRWVVLKRCESEAELAEFPDAIARTCNASRVVVTCPPDDASAPPSRRGRQPTYDSDGFLIEAFRLLYENRARPTTQADLMRRTLDAYKRRGYPVGKSADEWGKKKLRKLWRELELGSPEVE